MIEFDSTMRFNITALLTICAIILLPGCKKERSGYYEIHVSNGPFWVTYHSPDPNHPIETFYETDGHSQRAFTKKRRDNYFVKVESDAESSETVEIIINVFYGGRLMETYQLTANNKPVLTAEGDIQWPIKD